ncbi:hypothetical protein EBU94_01900, partial [bacterium]|nr:hypothetical protein [bacterium]
RTYKSLGGEYINIGKKNMSDLERWFAEKWIDVCALPKKVPCGRKNAGKKNYPYCRPTIRVNKNTPKTVDEIPLKKLKERCKAKRKNPSKKIRC